MKILDIIRTGVSAIALLAGTFLSAQTTGSQTAILERMRTETCKLSIEYTVTGQSDIDIIGEGSLTLQGDSYIFTTNGLETRSDGSSVWIADLSAKEVIIESSAVDGLSYLDPAYIFQNVISDPESSALEFVNGELKGVDVDIKEMDGMHLHITVHSYEFIQAQPESVFRFSESCFDSSWVVTDLR